MSNITIRYAYPNDLDFIYSSLIELFTEQHVIDRFSQTREMLSQTLFSPPSSVETLIAELENKPVGLALFSTTNRNFLLFDGPGLYLHDLYVNKENRRNGVATALFNQLKKIAEERSYTRIDWVLLKNNELGQHFYANITSAKPVDYIQYMRVNCATPVLQDE